MCGELRGFEESVGLRCTEASAYRLRHFSGGAKRGLPAAAKPHGPPVSFITDGFRHLGRPPVSRATFIPSRHSLNLPRLARRIAHSSTRLPRNNLVTLILPASSYLHPKRDRTLLHGDMRRAARRTAPRQGRRPLGRWAGKQKRSAAPPNTPATRPGDF